MKEAIKQNLTLFDKIQVLWKSCSISYLKLEELKKSQDNFKLEIDSEEKNITYVQLGANTVKASSLISGAFIVALFSNPVTLTASTLTLGTAYFLGTSVQKPRKNN